MPGTVVLQSVSKVFRHRPALFNWIGRERMGETRALDDVSLSAAAGRVLVLLGPNGSGKTTLLKLISTMLLPDAGRVLVGGADTIADAGAVRRQVGFAVATERSFFARLTGRENLDFFAALEGVPRAVRPERVQSALSATELGDAADTLVMKFSSGMYQKLGIARALLKHPSVLLLDEPSRSLDPGATSRLWELVTRAAGEGAAVIVTTHHFEEAAAVGHEVIVLHRGRVAAERRLTGSTSVSDLRAWYFQHVPEAGPAAAVVRGQA